MSQIRDMEDALDSLNSEIDGFRYVDFGGLQNAYSDILQAMSNAEDEFRMLADDHASIQEELDEYQRWFDDAYEAGEVKEALRVIEYEFGSSDVDEIRESVREEIIEDLYPELEAEIRESIDTPDVKRVEELEEEVSMLKRALAVIRLVSKSALDPQPALPEAEAEIVIIEEKDE